MPPQPTTASLSPDSGTQTIEEAYAAAAAPRRRADRIPCKHRRRRVPGEVAGQPFITQTARRVADCGAPKADPVRIAGEHVDEAPLEKLARGDLGRPAETTVE